MPSRLQTIPQNVYDSEDQAASIGPLPMVLKTGLAFVTACGFLSFFTTLSLFTFLSYKFMVWQVRPVRENDTIEPESPEKRSSVNGFLVPDSHLCPQKDNDWDAPLQKARETEEMKKTSPNQFLVLIYNLLFADIQQSTAFWLNVNWLTRDKVDVGTTICYAQGWFVSTGDLASSVFLTAIAIHTYMAIVKGYRLPTWAFYMAIGLMWAFIYGLAVLGVIITDQVIASKLNPYERDMYGLYVRAGAWCWINSKYQDLRLYLHYLWIFISLALTTLIYLSIFLTLYKKKEENTDLHDRNGMVSRRSSSSSSGSSTLKGLTSIPASAKHHPAFLLYPLIYVCCTAPLAAGRIASMAGNDVSLAYFCFAGAMIASNGFLDVLLYATTRRAIVFSDAPPSEDVGLETFAFMRTPPGRKFGNVVFVSGGSQQEDAPKLWRTWSSKSVKDRLGSLRNVNRSSGGSNNSSSDSLRGFGVGKGEVMGMAIQCETTTSVVVEVEGDEKEMPGSPPGSRKGSIASLTGPHKANRI